MAQLSLGVRELYFLKGRIRGQAVANISLISIVPVKYPASSKKMAPTNEAP